MNPQERLTAFIVAVVASCALVYVVTAAEPPMSPPAPLPATTTVEREVRAAQAPESTTSSVPPVVVDSGSTPLFKSEPRNLNGVEPNASAVWQRVADCESGEWTRRGDPSSARPGSANWQDNRGGYEGGLHWLPSTWRRAGGHAYAVHAYDATPAQQILVAQLWLGLTSVYQWPTCGPAMGLRDSDGIQGEQ